MSWSEVLAFLDRIANTTLFSLAGTDVNTVSIVTFFLIPLEVC